MVQRNEEDAMTNLIRPDSTPFEPGYFVTFAEIDDSPRIYSFRQSSNRTEMYDILYLWTNFDTGVWKYFFVGLFICLILFVLIAATMTQFQMRKLIKIFIISIWNYFTLSVDMAASVILPFRSAIILWTCICISILYAIHIVLMGTLSSDLTVSITPRVIESLKDLLYDPEFNQTQPIILRQMNMYFVLRNSRPGTDERALFDKIMTNESAGLRDIDTKNQQRGMSMLYNFLDKCINGEIALIENSELTNINLKYSGCYFNPDLVGKIKPANDIVSQSILSGLISKHTPISIRRYIQHRVLVAGDGALTRAFYESFWKYFVTTRGSGISIYGMICIKKLDKIYLNELHLPWESFAIDPFERLIRICFGINVLALLVLIFEIARMRYLR